MSSAIIFTLVIVVLVGMFIYYYNQFIKLGNQADESFSGVDVQLKRRHDLIPNLVETVKGYAKHESTTLEKVISARNMAMNATGVQNKAQAENMITGALKSLFALSENYPDLKANQNFMSLQSNLFEIEDNIQNARRYYNAVVRDFNILCEAFPSVIVGKIFNFTKREFFEIDEAERGNVKVSFN